MFELIWNGPEVIKRFTGAISFDEFVQASLQVQRDPRFDQLRSVINDLTGCTVSAEPDPVGMEEVAARDAAAALSNPNICVAVVASSPEVERAVQAYANSDISPFRICIFDSLEAARRWVANNPQPLVVRHTRIR